MVILLFLQSSAGCVYSREINVASTYEGTSQIVPLLVHAGQTDGIDEGTEYCFLIWILHILLCWYCMRKQDEAKYFTRD